MPSNFYSEAKISELESAIARWGSSREDNPKYAIIGAISDDSHRKTIGTICFADNEISAYRLAAVAKKFGRASVEKTNFHPDGLSFDLFKWEQLCSTVTVENLHLLVTFG